MFTSNLIPIVIEPVLREDELITNLEEVEKQIENYGAENILCVFSTTSCFAPRGYDSIKELAILSKKYNIFHVVNNAYGIYCTKITDMISQAVKSGNVDVIISSTDKNFMVPVGGSLIYSPREDMINKIKKNYPGRASMAPILDLFITLLAIGKDKYKLLTSERKEKYKNLKQNMIKISEKYKEKVLENPNNKISIAMTMESICKDAKDSKEVTYLGSLFYSRQISGIKVVARTETIDFNGYKFSSYGSHSESYPFLPYCTFAAAIGISDTEVTDFCTKFCDIIDSYLNRNKISQIILEKKSDKKEEKIKDVSSSFSISKADCFSI